MDFLFQIFNTADPTYLAMGIMAVVFGIYMAWSIGANDVANAMATSVGSGTISFKQAVLIAGFFELFRPSLRAAQSPIRFERGLSTPTSSSMNRHS